MLIKKLAAGVAVLGLATAPVMAQVAPAIAPIADESELGGENSSIIALGLLAGIVAIAVLAIADSDDDPVSP